MDIVYRSVVPGTPNPRLETIQETFVTPTVLNTIRYAPGGKGYERMKYLMSQCTLHTLASVRKAAFEADGKPYPHNNNEEFVCENYTNPDLDNQRLLKLQSRIIEANSKSELPELRLYRGKPEDEDIIPDFNEVYFLESKGYTVVHNDIHLNDGVNIKLGHKRIMW